MASLPLDIVAIGDAIVDVIATCGDSFLNARGIEKGSHRLLSPAETQELYEAMGPAVEVSGGSAANSMEGLAVLGLQTAFIGQVADDQLGGVFAHDLRSIGIRFETPPIAPPPPSGVCLVLVTPDAQRTMNACPGASHELTPAALDPSLIRSAAITFLEGYLWEPERPRAAMLEAARISRSAGRSIAFTLSESVAVRDRRDGVARIIEAGLVDILFGNEKEMRDVTGFTSLDECIAALSPKVDTLVITRGAQGAVGVERGEQVAVAATPVDSVVDTTGAGDLFAAGFLAAKLRGRPLRASLEAGAIAASEIISHFGTRPEADLKALLNLS
jgi:sugar/nucleoside kinase (ribokinase family)